MKIALIRATNIIPINKTIKCLANTPNLILDKNSSFAFALIDLLKEENIIDYKNCKTTAEKINLTNIIAKKYLSYISNYNSVVLFSLNGLVPDDSEIGFANNTFSNKDIVIIDDLDYHLHNSHLVSLNPTDTAILGDVILSNKAIIMIKKDRYITLTKEQKQMLNNRVILFTGDLRKNVEKVLKENGYKPERPLLGRSHNGFKDSETKDKLLKTIKGIQENYHISNIYHLNYALKNDTLSVKALIDFFLKKLYFYLYQNIKFNEKLLNHLLEQPTSDYYINMLMNEIRNYGLNKYLELITKYNQELLLLKSQNKLPSPMTIIKSQEQKESITLN